MSKFDRIKPARRCLTVAIPFVLGTLLAGAADAQDDSLRVSVPRILT
jgi:hypothetical protein